MSFLICLALNFQRTGGFAGLSWLATTVEVPNVVLSLIMAALWPRLWLTLYKKKIQPGREFSVSRPLRRMQATGPCSPSPQADDQTTRALFDCGHSIQDHVLPEYLGGVGAKKLAVTLTKHARARS